MKLFVCLLFTLLPAALFSQSTKPSIANEPAWITKNTIDYSKTSLDKNATDGYVDIGYEVQVSLATQSEYVRRSKKILSQSGVQNGSEISVSFDPSYEQLFFHTIHIIRNGESINRLQLSNIKTIHQEKELNNFIYNGSLNALLILEDVRKGDIIEYSYTIKGFNPIFKNKYAAGLELEFSIPLYDIYYKLIVPQGRKMIIKNVNSTLQPVMSNANGEQVYEWRKSKVPPLRLQDYTPSWYHPFAEVLVSEYNNWKEVNDWAMELFPLKKQLSPAVQKKVKEIESTCTGDAARLQAALRFVQDDIRYMGIEMGENTHKPADPSKVFAQRFGDCKEKSYLLCCLLQAMNITASPVLINTDSKKSINAMLPAPIDFDHVTVRVNLDGVYYWFDPTIAYQRGNIKNLFYPDYQAGLVIADGTENLSAIPFRANSFYHVLENFKVTEMYGGGTLLVTTTFEGNDADMIRSDFNEQSMDELMTSYQKFYAGYYDDIKGDSITYTDNDSTGVFTTREYYTLPKFWKVDKGQLNKFSISPFIIDAGIRRPKEKDRKMPFRLSYPAKYKEEITVELPEEWKVTEDETHLKNACFAYNSKFYCTYNHVHLETDYESYKDHATVEEAPVYFKDLAAYESIDNFDLTSGSDELVKSSNSATSSTDNILSGVVLLVVVVGGFLWWSQRR